MLKRTLVAAGALIVIGLGAFRLVPDRVPMVGAAELGAFGFEPGELVADFRYRAVDGRRGSLASLIEEHEAVVVVMRLSECPVSLRYGHRLAELEAEFGERGAGFLFLDVSPQDTPETARADIETFGFQAPYVLDPDGEIGTRLQARVSSEVFVIDRAGTLRYRGAVDDQFGIAFSNPVVRETWLRDALDAVLTGEPVEVAKTEASGCYVEGGPTLVPERAITYHSRVGRILDRNCVTCHRIGGVGPMALDSYQQAFGFRHMIRHMVEQELMPPWYASPEHGEWANDRRLSERDRRDLFAWIDAGAPEGDAASAPLRRGFAEGWQLGRAPDAVIRIPEAREVPAQGVLEYDYMYVKTNWEEDRWVTAAEIVPTAPQVTHHVIVFLEEPDAEERGPWLVGYAPGMQPSEWPEGTAKRIPAGAWLMFELHYTPNGQATSDETQMGLVFADEEPESHVVTTAVMTTDFEIPPHAPDHEVVAEMTFERPGRILTLLPHMHLRGKAFRYELIRDDGTQEILLDVPRYDFNWQLWYESAEPIRIRPGDRLRGRAWYDNSEANPANPDPSVPVRYGEQSFEEMMFGFFEWVPEPRPTEGSGSR